MASALVTRKLTHVFNAFDRHSNGVLESGDFEALADSYIRETGMDPDSDSSERFRAYFMEWWESFKAMADADRGGTVSLDEFIALLSPMAAAPEPVGVAGETVFDAIDTDGDGVIAVDEYQMFLTVYGLDPSQAEDVFSRLDTDGDGSISRDEFATLMIQMICGDDPEAPGNWLFGALG